MSFLDQLHSILVEDRRLGHTTAAAGKGDGNHIVVCQDQREATRVAREFKVQAQSIGHLTQLFGHKPKPMVYDTSAVQHLVRIMLNQLDKRDAEIGKLRHELSIR